MKYLVFVFKRRFRQRSLNNFLKSKKIKNFKIIDFSGPLLSFLGKFLYLILRSKKIIFISCDGLDFLKREQNAVNFWMGGTTYKIPEKYKNFQNNFVAASTIFTDDSKLLTFFPTLITKNKMNKNFKFVYISENKQIELSQSFSIWEKYENKILDRLDIINEKEFWKNILDINSSISQQIYIDVKSLIRIRLLEELYKKLKNQMILVGSNWKKLYPNALKDNYSNKFVEEIYKGNICIDFGSKNSERSIYSRTCKIVESGGILFQSKQKDSKNIFGELFDITCFTSLNDMNDKVDYFLKNRNNLDEILLKQRKNFENEDFNYQTLLKISNFVSQQK